MPTIDTLEMQNSTLERRLREVEREMRTMQQRDREKAVSFVGDQNDIETTGMRVIRAGPSVIHSQTYPDPPPATGFWSDTSASPTLTPTAEVTVGWTANANNDTDMDLAGDGVTILLPADAGWYQISCHALLQFENDLLSNEAIMELLTNGALLDPTSFSYCFVNRHSSGSALGYAPQQSIHITQAVHSSAFTTTIVDGEARPAFTVKIKTGNGSGTITVLHVALSVLRL